MSWLSSWAHPERGYEAGQQQLDKYYQQMLNNLLPYSQRGDTAYNGLSHAQNELQDPETLLNKWIKGYKESEAAKNTEEMATQHGLNSASSMGLVGSTPALRAIQAGTANISAQDRQGYLNDLMQKYLAGAGIAQNIYNTGAGAAAQFGQNAMNMGQNSANLAYNQQNAQGDLFGKLLGGGLSLGAGALGGYLGGPAGAAAGAKAAGNWSTTGAH